MKNTLETRLGIFFALALVVAVVILELIGAAGNIRNQPGPVRLGQVDAGFGIGRGFAQGLIGHAARVIQDLVASDISLQYIGEIILELDGRATLHVALFDSHPQLLFLRQVDRALEHGIAKPRDIPGQNVIHIKS